jgi:hypothetical protein
MQEAMDNTAKLASFVLFILIGSTVFSFTFNAADGHIWVEHLFDKVPGGQIGFLIVVNLLIFVLGMFIDFFEIAFIVIPLLAPVAEKMGIDMIWFGVIVAMNLQTSFLTPPFGFALFYLRSVAARKDYKDRVTGKTIAGVKTTEIYKGLVTGNIEKAATMSDEEIMRQLDSMGMGAEDPAETTQPNPTSEPAEDAASDAMGEPAADAPADDPLKDLEKAAEEKK